MKLEVFKSKKPRRIVLDESDFKNLMDKVESHNPKNEIDEMAYFFYWTIRWGYETYNPKGSLQCDEDRNRSFSDMYRLLYSYYDLSIPKYVKVLNMVYHMMGNTSKYNLDGRIGVLYCPNVRKFVFSKPYRHGMGFDYRNSNFIKNISTEFSGYNKFKDLLVALNCDFQFEKEEEVSIQTL